jgi:hypothetical protein
MKKFKEFISEKVELVFKSGRGYNNSVAHIAFSNKGISDRSIFLPSINDKSVWSSSDLKDVFRWYGNDDPKDKRTGLIKIDVSKGTVKFIDDKKYIKNNEDLSKDVWGREYKLNKIVVFDKSALRLRESVTDFIAEQNQLSADYIESNSAKEVEDFKKELQKMLGQKIVVKAVYSTNLGRSAHIRITDVDVKVTDHNSPVFTQFFIDLGRKKSDLKKISIELSTWHHQLKNSGLKFRKITSNKSLKDALDKLLAWFQKNKSTYQDQLK